MTERAREKRLKRSAELMESIVRLAMELQKLWEQDKRERSKTA